MQVWCSVKEHDLPAVGDFLVGATSECYFLGSRLEIDTRANAASASSAGYFHLLCAAICMYVCMYAYMYVSMYVLARVKVVV